MPGAIRGTGPPQRYRFCLIGQFRLLSNGADLEPHAIASRKGRSLLKLLVVNRGHLVPTDQIVETLWDEPPARPQENVAILVSRLRALIGASAIAGRTGGYTFVGGDGFEVDLDEAHRLVEEAEARLRAEEPSLARSAAVSALDLLGAGRILEDEPYAAWTEGAQAFADQLLARAERATWRAALALAAPAEAIRVATQAIGRDPLNEEASRAIMVAHQRSGEPAAALAAYERLRDVLADELGVDPAPETQALHLAVLRGVEARLDGLPDRPSVHGVAAVEADFVGRDAELADLKQEWQSVLDAQGRLVVVAGEGGIGKTRLAREVARLARATGGFVVEARCYEAERSLFLQPFVDAIRSFAAGESPEIVHDAAGESAGTLAELVPDLRPLVAPRAYVRAPAELERRRSFEAVAMFLGRLARRRPLLLLLDDLHQAGASTIELLHFARRRLDRDRFLAIGTVRSEEGADVLGQLSAVGRVLQLGPLPQSAVVDLAARMHAPHWADQVFRRTRGHTLFVVESLRAVSEGGGGNGDAALPDSLRGVVLARLQRVGPEVEEFLRAAVVIGAAFGLETAADLLGLPMPEVTRRAERALEARLIVQSGAGYEFANDLVKDAVYHSTPLPTRIVRHRRVALLLEETPEAAALHFAAAGDHERALEAWTAAARRATSTLANREGEALLDRALDAAAHVEDPLASARVRLARGKVREALGDFRGAHGDHSTALQLARAAGDADLEAQALERIGWTAYYAKDLSAGHELEARADEFAERAAAAPEARPSALVLAGRLRHARGDVEGALRAFETVLTGDADAATRATARSYLAHVLEHTDRFVEASSLLDPAIEEARAAGAFRPLLNNYFFAAMAQANLGLFGGALGHLERLGRLVEESSASFYRPRMLNVASWVWRELGELTRANDLAGEALDLARALGAVAGQAEPEAHAVMAVAECALLAGEDADAAERLGGLESLRERAFGWRFELRRVELLVRLEPGRAGELLDLARAVRSPKYEALALAVLGHPEEAADLARRVGSDWLLAQVSGPDESRAAVARMAAALPPDLRGCFIDRGRVPVAVLGRR